mmetsp:Transcript_57462/g.147766  ORF Transcript_57462/g.147766 Transcript_57462/m.147766 type:complete len:213 (+) Transcript_57462:482-1120(+)
MVSYPNILAHCHPRHSPLMTAMLPMSTLASRTACRCVPSGFGTFVAGMLGVFMKYMAPPQKPLDPGLKCCVFTMMSATRLLVVWYRVMMLPLPANADRMVRLPGIASTSEALSAACKAGGSQGSSSPSVTVSKVELTPVSSSSASVILLKVELPMLCGSTASGVAFAVRLVRRPRRWPGSARAACTASARIAACRSAMAGRLRGGPSGCALG